MRYINTPQQLSLFGPPYEYIIDACSMIAQNANSAFPRALHPVQWSYIDEMVRVQKIVTCEQIRREICDTGDDVSKWVVSSGLYVIEEDYEVQRKVALIVNEHRELLDFTHNKSSGDAFLIATAMVYGLDIITEESPLSIKKIPFIAKQYGITSYRLKDFCALQGWGT